MMDGHDRRHTPVLCREVVEHLEPRADSLIVDGNLGLGGHSRAILSTGGAGCRIIGFDWDKEALAQARVNLAEYGDHVQFVRSNFAEIERVLGDLGIREIDGLLLDLGLSSLQLDESGRGFSFKGDEPLDMRMDDRGSETAADLLHDLSEQELADMFYFFGEDRQARRIAEFVVQARKEQAITSTSDLVNIIARAVPKKFQPKKIHVATKVFQALRIAVNHEFDNLIKVLDDGVQALKPGGKFCVISFHSLEDRLVKRAFKNNHNLVAVTTKPIIASQEECAENPRARSAKLRVARKRDEGELR